MRPTLRQLEYALAVAEHHHFRRAAQACHVTQPALSAQIAQLEDLLGVRIFERNRRQVRVTPAGARLLERMRACLREVDELEDLAAHLSRPGAGPLRIGVIPTVAPYLLPGLLPALRDHAPDYELQLWEAQTSTLLEKLDRGELDLLLLALPLPGVDRRGTPLGDEPFVLLVPAEHPLATGPAPGEDQLDGEPLLLLAEGHCLREHALAACRLSDPELPALAVRLRAMEDDAVRARTEGDTAAFRALVEERAEIRERFMRAREAAMRRPDLAARIRTYEERLRARMSQVEPALDSLLLRGELLQTRLAELVEQRRTRSGPSARGTSPCSRRC